MNLFTITALRIVHIVSGIFWVGAALMNAFFLIPAIRASGPAGGQVMANLVQQRKLPQIVNVAILLTVASGLVLYGWRAGGGPWMMTRSGLVFGTGAVLAIIIAIVGVTTIAPTAARIGTLAASAASATGDELAGMRADIQRLQVRLQNLAQGASIVLLVAAACMAAGRYV